MNPIEKNRRSFLQKTAALSTAAVAGGMFGSPELFGSQPTLPDDEKLGVAMVGLGSLSTNQIAPALQKTKRCKLAAIVSGTAAKREKWSKQYDLAPEHIYTYETFDKIAEDETVDIIYVVLPNGMHCEYTVRAAKAGKHVFCEKPMAISSVECRQMIDACEKAERLLGIGYRCQFEPHHRRCIELAESKTFGDIKGITGGFGFKIGDPTQWRLNKKLAGGGPLMDVGIYALQACRYLTGLEPELITATQTKTDPVKFAEVEETLSWTMKMGDVNCSLMTTYAFNGINNFHAYCDNGNFGLDPAFNYSGIKGKSSKGPIEFEQVDHFAAELDHFAECISNGTELRVPGETGLQDLLIMEAIFKAADSGLAIKPESI
ncbi:Gfo/Idh/MocA family protein [Mariniblastus fucicola]|uniref:Glucose--fructose oxidoreductase n=1 Tax=Mariniblastus fucicola TaxID=980251 RepID=A0A5B9PKC9_9BACT|nr:Gfo/Idh/MocA family oxidoreductase [Mariniblastus fucicola]QEG23121.1 Glucose--fructose oxidoreductase precursor [Mariniblastus fucicola]